MSRPNPTALIAEDEPLLAQALQSELAHLWPALQVVAVVGDGLSAVRETLRHAPEVVFLDIRMPGQSGLEAAADLLDQWSVGVDAPPFPALVFVTAFDAYAVQAFEAQAVDYVLKPVQSARLQKTVLRLQQVLARRAFNDASANTGVNTTAPLAGLEATLAQLRQLMAAQRGSTTVEAGAGGPLQMIQASVAGDSTICMVPLEDVIVFEAADKYVRVLTQSREYLIRTPLKELVAQLDAAKFWQIHRGTLVRASAIETVRREEDGKLRLTLRGRAEPLVVSRLYAHLFKAM